MVVPVTEEDFDNYEYPLINDFDRYVKQEVKDEIAEHYVKRFGLRKLNKAAHGYFD